MELRRIRMPINSRRRYLHVTHARLSSNTGQPQTACTSAADVSNIANGSRVYDRLYLWYNELCFIATPRL